MPILGHDNVCGAKFWRVHGLSLPLLGGGHLMQCCWCMTVFTVFTADIMHSSSRDSHMH